jgi:hypothetical protein
LFAFMGGVALLSAGFGAWRIRRTPPPAAEDQGAFRFVPTTTPIASELDPRAGPEEPVFDFTIGAEAEADQAGSAAVAGSPTASAGTPKA